MVRAHALPRRLGCCKHDTKAYAPRYASVVGDDRCACCRLYDRNGGHRQPRQVYVAVHIGR
jgi:hypothetical protein